MATLYSTACLFIALSLFLGLTVCAVPYDYSYTHDCLTRPLEPQYGGGIVENAELDEGLKGWFSFGGAKVEQRESSDGNKYIVVASNRKQYFHSFAQKFNLEKDKLYTFSAWLQVSNGPAADVAAIFKTPNSNEIAGRVTAQKGCWSMLKGGVVVNVSGPAQLYFESKNTDVELWADNISLQPFTQEEWESHQRDGIEKSRKTRVKLQAIDSKGQPIANATVSITQNSGSLPLGCAMSQNILNNQAYQNWFTSRFKYTVFENEMKWYSTEKTRGKVDYSVPDSMLRFAQSHGITIRGHNILWDDPKYQPDWVKSLGSNDLLSAVNSRLDSITNHYKGQLIHWDVVNENLHFNLYESKLGRNFSAVAFQKANQIDPKMIPFLNEYNTIEEKSDFKSNSGAYLQKIREMRAQGYGGPLGIGLEGHFTNVNLPYVRSTIDVLSFARLPIWITEFDVVSGPNQSTLLEQLFREFISRGPLVKGIMVWSAWNPGGCYRMCLTDNNFANLATGNVVDKILKELSHKAEYQVRGTTDSNGFFEASLFHGEYEALLRHVNGEKVHKFGVGQSEEGALHVKINTV